MTKWYLYMRLLNLLINNELIFGKCDPRAIKHRWIEEIVTFSLSFAWTYALVNE